MEARVTVRPPSGPALPWAAILFLLIPVVIGAAAIWVAAGIRADEAAYEREGALAIGTVVDKAIVPGSDNSSDYRLTYTFTTADGRRIAARADVTRERYQETAVGDTVDVTYLSTRPGTNRIGGPTPGWVAYLIGIGGVAMVLLGLGLFTSNVIIRLQRQPSGGIGPQGVEPGVTYVFRRPLSRILVDLLGAPFAAAMFLGGAWFVGIRNAAELDLLTRTVVVLGFGFFGVLVLSGVPYGLRRGLRPAVLEIGPDGIWMPELGRLAWSEIREVRLEAIRGARGSSTHPSGTTIEVGGFRYASAGAMEPDMETATYGRLGIVPLDPERERRERGHLAWRLVRGFLGFARRSGRKVDVTDPDAMAPFGAYDFDLGGSLDGAVAAVRLYRQVTLPQMPAAQPAPA